MKYTVELTRSAEADLNDIVEWIARNDSVAHALHVLEQIQTRLESLCRQAERGSVPLELRNLGIDRYRRVLFKSYRIIYHVRDRRVIVNLIVDGRSGHFTEHRAAGGRGRSQKPGPVDLLGALSLAGGVCFRPGAWPGFRRSIVRDRCTAE